MNADSNPLSITMNEDDNWWDFQGEVMLDQPTEVIDSVVSAGGNPKKHTLANGLRHDGAYKNELGDKLTDIINSELSTVGGEQRKRFSVTGTTGKKITFEAVFTTHSGINLEALYPVR